MKKKFTLHVVCSSNKCIELVEVKRYDNKTHYCIKCEKRINKESKGLKQLSI